mmetsp:Transcript_27154/g.87746  ORF Transcript_27154/g.87746 Transcript_27154/m.87746 type:complete len:127 (-) Transcript_27154:23-403(-)
MFRSTAMRLLKGSKWPKPLIPSDEALPIGCLVGEVTSDKMQKSVVVRVTRSRLITLYDVRQKYHRKYMAHDEQEVQNSFPFRDIHSSQVCKIGDTVRISPCRPLSKRKFYMVQKILKRAPVYSYNK